MKLLIYFMTFFHVHHYAWSEIRDSSLLNRLANIKPVGLDPSSIKNVDFPRPTQTPSLRRYHVDPSGRRHLPEECTQGPQWKEAAIGPKVAVFGDYYDDFVMRTVATVRIPEHIDHMHFDITSPEPYLTLGTIDGLGYHPSTIKSAFPPECERIYQDHIAAQYSDESNDMEGESMEMARVHIDDLADAQAGRGNWKK